MNKGKCNDCFEEARKKVREAQSKQRYICVTGPAGPPGPPGDNLIRTAYLVTFNDGTKFDSQMFIYNEILVNLPMKVLCRTDCKGICNRCGVNLNVSTCKCQDAEPGTGMSKILDVFNQFKEV